MFSNNTELTVNLECAETASSLHCSKDLNYDVTLPWDDSLLPGFIQSSQFHLTMLYDDGGDVDNYKSLINQPDEPASSPSQRWLDDVEGVSRSGHLFSPIVQTVPGSMEIICMKSATRTDIHRVPCSPKSSTNNNKKQLGDKDVCTVPDVDNISSESEVSDSDDTSHIVFSSIHRRMLYNNECVAEQSCFVTSDISSVETTSDTESEYAVFSGSQTSTVSTSEWEPARSVNSCSLTSDHVVPNIEE